MREMTWPPIAESLLERRDWKDQYERVIRWRVRLAGAAPGIDPDLPALRAFQDYVHAFFVDCYHLTDWLLEAGVAGEDEMKDFFLKNKCLRVAQGICDSAKHFHLRKRHDSKFYREHYGGAAIVVAESSTGVSAVFPQTDPSIALSGQYFVTTDEGTHDILTLADQCILAWTQLITSKGLELPIDVEGTLVI
jgi:hypothetical protein